MAQPGRWSLWALPTLAVAWIVTTEVGTAVAVSTVIAREGVPPMRSWLRFAAIGTAAVIHVVLTRPTKERRRAERLRIGDVEHVDHTSIWQVAAALLLPMAHVTVLWALLRTHRYLITRHPPARYPLPSTTILASALAVHLLARHGGVTMWRGHGILGPHVPSGTALRVTFVLIAAPAVYVVTQVILVGIARAFIDRHWGLGVLVGSARNSRFAVSVVALGCVAAVTVAVAPALLVFIPVVAIRSTRDEHRKTFLAAESAHARHDRLTGLPNRHVLEPWAESAVAAGVSSQVPVAVLIIDVDHFKKINDRYGHLTGDQVLRALAARLAASVREGDLVGRWGGEEFLIVAPVTPAADAAALAERCRRGVEALSVQRVSSARQQRPAQHGSDTYDAIRVLGCTVSVGVAIAPTHGATMGELIDTADRQLLAAKHAGRNRVHVAEEIPARQR